MEAASDRRFDPNQAVRLLLDIAQEQSLQRLLDLLVSRVLAGRSVNICCVQIWLMEKGDRCVTCPQKPRCPDQRHCLHLVAGGGELFSDPNATRPRAATTTARIPIGLGPIGEAANGRQIILRNLDQTSVLTAEFGWLEQRKIRGFSGTPIIYKGKVLGIMAVFARTNVPDEALPWGQVFADHVGAAIANARAFEEIQRLKGQLESQNAYLEEEVVEAKAFGDLVGQSAALEQVIRQINLVAPTEASVLILGETGTGKELVAREIHRRSLRKDGPLVRVNCASIPRELFESEFFGHVRGAFTGAVKDRAGRFETADGGTLFLDEIGDLPMEMQGKLLRVLQENSYERVGEDRSRHVDVRIIEATNRDLKQAVAAGRFREDLFYRLHVFPIHIAPLRERKDDIPLLARHFVDLSVKQLKCLPPRLTRAGITRLQSYDWPGNVRELRNVIERAVILARGGALDFDLPITASSAAPAISRDNGGRESKFLTEAELRSLERDNLLGILAKTGWKLSGPNGAAEWLGIKPTTLFSRMKKMGIAPPGNGT